MIKAPKKPADVKDEQGAEERFTRGIKKALDTPPKSHDELMAERKGRKVSSSSKRQEVRK